MNLIKKINAISEEAKNQFKPDLKKYGKNFRAISDSAVLEVLSPLLKKYNLCYAVHVKDQKLTPIIFKAGSDMNNNPVERYIFLAEAVVQLVVRSSNNDSVEYDESITFEGWGSGLDFGDKATGKAITAAVKYALFKGFRLQYSDDPDADASEEIEAASANNPPKEEKAPKNAKTPKKEKTEEPLATEKMLNYIMGLVKRSNMTDEDFFSMFGCYPYEKDMSMRKAREIIDKLNELPF